MDSVKFTMDGDMVRVSFSDSQWYVATYAELQDSIDSLKRNIIAKGERPTRIRILQEQEDAMAYMREHLTVEMANAKYAVDTNTAWAAIGVKGGAL